MLAHDFLPVFEISDAVATVVTADVEGTWDALMEVDLTDVGRKRPLIAVRGGLRGLPDIVIISCMVKRRRRHPRTFGCATPPRCRRIKAVGFCWFRRYGVLGVGSAAHILVSGRRPWGYVIAALASVQGALYLLVLSVNSIIAIRRGLAAAPGELPIWGTSCYRVYRPRPVGECSARAGRLAMTTTRSFSIRLYLVIVFAFFWPFSWHSSSSATGFGPFCSCP